MDLLEDRMSLRRRIWGYASGGVTEHFESVLIIY